MTAQTYGPPKADASFRAAQRLVLDAGARFGLAPLADGGGALELSASAVEAPRVLTARPLEGATPRPVKVPGDPTAGFTAFLDGTQRSQVLTYTPDGVPIVHATVAAVVRRRVNRRMSTWTRGPLVRPFVFVPRTRVSAAQWDFFFESGLPVVDTTAGEAGASSSHPLALRDLAYHAVQAARELVEQELAEAWCAKEHDYLYVDGGISGSEKVATAGCAVGVIKTHRTLYAEGDVLQGVIGLKAGWRSSAFLVTSARRAAVASWYLRLRDARGRDPLWGLVRVESARVDEVTARADEISRMVLAEAAPLALPDGRWDKMVYGIRDCEEYLRAIC
ncbi:MAG: hypothetical protein ACJ8AO_20785 [Gemmatimonadaceae bacterium]